MKASSALKLAAVLAVVALSLFGPVVSADPMLTVGVAFAGLSRWVDLPQMVNVGPAKQALIDRVPQGDVYEAFVFKLGGTLTKAQLNNVIFTLGGKRIWDATGTHADKLFSYMKRTANAAYLAVWFADPNSRTVFGSSIGAIDTSVGYSDFSVKVDLDAAAAAGSTLECKALVSDPVSGDDPDRLKIRCLLKATQAPASAADHDLQPNLGSEAGALLRQLHLFHANLTNLYVTKDGIPLQDKAALADIQFLQNELRRTTQAGHFAFDPLAYYDNQSDSVPTLKRLGDQLRAASFKFRATLSAADVLTLYSDIYTTVAAL